MEIKSQCKDVLQNSTAYINTEALFDASCKHILCTTLLRLLHSELTALGEIRNILYAQKAVPCRKPFKKIFLRGMSNPLHA